ncbi:rRNA methyltransferase [Oceanobacillus jeddahense]|uniref:rRNA methyltransferase n=1 Tax=Oceanobacillus jeddahense TaxID=1462527 RepID=A0ABY5JNI1_9BACI|nr:rRNA methyltransferase [Oceanobacillus jeddahense]UUI01017.1 rRNA methyltransferase [Oceanobacillus jeddahense]
MWKLVNGKLIQTTDTSRVKFRTNVSKSIIDQLNAMAVQYDTYPNYLLESGLRAVLTQGVIQFDKKSRPKDRIQYKTTYDKELLLEVKDFAKENKLSVNDVLEYSVHFIDFDSVKKRSYKHRIEKL